MAKTIRKSERVDIYARVTEKIISDLEQGVRPWLKPWNTAHAAGRISRPLRSNGVPYQGINILMLWASAEDAGFNCPYWLTFQQAKELGGFVRKGEQGSPVIYANSITKTGTDEAGEETEEKIPYLKQYTVFNGNQVDGLPEHFYALAEPPQETMQRIAHAESFFANTKAEIRTGGDRAFDAIGLDYVRMPPFECFRDAESQAATLAHELIHWTRHSSRLDRDLGRRNGAMLATRWKNLSPKSAQRFFVRIFRLRRKPVTPRGLYRELAYRPKERQAGDFHCRIICQ